MDAYGVSMNEFAQIGSKFSVNSAGSIIRDYGNEYMLRGMARTNDTKQLGATFVRTVNDESVLASDVAEIVSGSAKSQGMLHKTASPQRFFPYSNS
jgi:Cu/Ag efflux pump CusA